MLKQLALGLIVAALPALAHDCDIYVGGQGSGTDQIQVETQARENAVANFRAECERARCSVCPEVSATLHESFPDPISEAWRATAGAMGHASSCEEITDVCR